MIYLDATSSKEYNVTRVDHLTENLPKWIKTNKFFLTEETLPVGLLNHFDEVVKDPMNKFIFLIFMGCVTILLIGLISHRVFKLYKDRLIQRRMQIRIFNRTVFETKSK